MAHHWEQVNAVQFCARLGKSPAETHDLLLQAYQQEALRKVATKAYYSRFQKRGNTTTPVTYGRKSLGNVKNKSNRKLFYSADDSNSDEFQSNGHDTAAEHGSPRCIDINLHLQFDSANHIDKAPSNSTIKDFLTSIESSCNQHLNPQKMRISTNHENVQVEEVDDQTIPEPSEESEPMQEVNGDSTQEDTISSSIPSLPSHETVVTTKKTTRETMVETSKTMVTKTYVATPRTTRSKCRCLTCKLKI